MRFGSDIIQLFTTYIIVNLQQILPGREFVVHCTNCAYQTLILQLNLCAKVCFGIALKYSLLAHIMQVKLFFVTFNLNCGLHTVSVRKPSLRMSNFWTVWFC